MEPKEFKFMVDSIREVERAMGSTCKEVVAEESETVLVQRRCLYAKRDLKKGQIITSDDLDVLRPALGIPPKFKDTLIGKTVNKDIPARDPIFWEDL
jgi:N-acetylneuraminate synthase